MSEKVEDNLSLEKIINSVDYNKLAEDYVPSSFAIKFINFIRHHRIKAIHNFIVIPNDDFFD